MKSLNLLNSYYGLKHFKLILLLLPHILMAQTDPPPSKTTNTISSLHQQAEEQLLTQPQHALELAQKSELLASQIGDQRSRAKALFQIGKSHRIQSRYRVAITHFVMAKQLYEKLNDAKMIGKIHNEIGMVYWQQKALEKAIIHHQEAKSIAQKIGADELQAYSLKHLGIVHFYKKNYRKSSHFYEKSLVLAEKLQDKKLLSALYNNIGIVYAKLNQEEQDKKMYQTVLEYYQKALLINESIGDVQLCAAIYDNIGDIYTILKAYDKAQLFLEKGLEKATSVRAVYRMMESYESLSELAKVSGNYQKAFHHFQAYIALKDSFIHIANDRNIEGLRAEYKTVQKDQELKLLKQSETLLKERQKSDQLMVISLSTACLLLVSSLGFGIYWLKVKLWKKNKLIESQRQEQIAKEKIVKMTLENERLAKQSLEQEVRNQNEQRNAYALQMVQKRELLEEIREELKIMKTTPSVSQVKKLLRIIDQGLNVDQEWELISQSLEKENTLFYGILREKFPKLTSKELRLCLLARLDMSTKAIALVLNIAPNSVSVARYRIRKKLNLPHEVSFNQFMQQIV